MSCLVEYVWIGGNGELRSKTKVMDKVVTSHTECPEWNFDGSSTGQAHGDDSEVLIRARAMFNDPFRGAPHKMVMCDAYKPDGTPHLTNKRVWANEVFNKKLDEVPWFGLEQEYFLINPTTGMPLGFPAGGLPPAQGQYYCSAGAANAFGRPIAEEHLIACITAGIKISGMNAEVAPGQWEYQIGPCTGIGQGDHHWMARFLLERVSEKHGAVVNLHPKPISGDWNGSGCHANYSTKAMREGADGKTGLDFIDAAIEKLSAKHAEHMAAYGTGNELRMTGQHETASFDKFTHGVASRGRSVRRGNQTMKAKKGYFVLVPTVTLTRSLA